MNPTSINVVKMFNHLNKKHFGGRLPYCDMRWSNRMTKTCGSIISEDRFIKLSVKYHEKHEVTELKDTILHEMIHLYLHENGNKSFRIHGKEFKKMAKKVGVNV